MLQGLAGLMEIDDFLAQASYIIQADRQAQYGNIEESWERIGKMWGALLELDRPIDPSMVGIMLAAMKLSRLTNHMNHEDSYIDALAYIAGAGQIATDNSPWYQT